ncbi:GNAT family N-acetyltransferase [Herbidospora solisilvae]|nr:GNAT family N-acetyltransferase [Herbidospora solisilvae]
MRDRQLTAIAEIAGMGLDVWLRGGWAMDFTLGEVTRDHVDIDWFAWSDDADRLEEALLARGFVPQPGPPRDQQRDFTREGVEVSFALLAPDLTVAGGPYKGERWPDGLLDAPMGRLDGLSCPVVNVAAQIEIKEMMPVWVPGLPRRDKDVSDLARLRMHVHLRDVRDSDLEVFHTQEQDPEATRRSRFPARERERFLNHWRQNILPDETCHVQTVEVGGQIAGNVVAWWQGDHRYLGYWLGREFWGGGIGTRALTLFLEKEKVRPLYADPHGGNTASVRLLEKLGFTRTTVNDDGFVLYVLEN